MSPTSIQPRRASWKRRIGLLGWQTPRIRDEGRHPPHTELGRVGLSTAPTAGTGPTGSKLLVEQLNSALSRPRPTSGPSPHRLSSPSGGASSRFNSRYVRAGRMAVVEQRRSATSGARSSIHRGRPDPRPPCESRTGLASGASRQSQCRQRTTSGVAEAQSGDARCRTIAHGRRRCRLGGSFAARGPSTAACIASRVAASDCGGPRPLATA